MVDNNVAYGRDNRASNFSDGDPLAELARIVGFDEKPAHVAPATRVATPVSVPVRREPEFNLEDELLREFDRYDAPVDGADAAVASPAEPLPYNVPSPAAALQSVAARGMAYSPAVEPVVEEARHVPVEEHFAPEEPDYPPFEDEYVQEDFAELEVDLASELEQAMDMAPPPQPGPVAVPQAVSPPRMSLATPVMPPRPAVTAPAIAPVAATPAVVNRNDTLSPMEELLYDVERYSLTSRNGEQAAPVLQEPVSVAPVVPFPVVPPAAVVQPFSPHVQEAIYGVQQLKPDMRVEPQIASPASAPITTPYQPPVRQEPEAPLASSADLADDFDDSGFNLALDDMEIDLDLSDIADVEQTDVEDMRTAPASSLHFDPGQIGDTDDVPETISEVDVPALPVHEPEARPARRAEDEFDIDSELAVLFNPQKSGSGISRQGRAPAQNVAADPERAVGEDEDFERALEEDFRRSLNAPIDNSSVSGQAMPPMNSADMYEDETGRRPGWLIPAAVAFVVLAAGGGYALMHSGALSTSSSSGGPVVIAAEKGPLKVVPENPGGKTVPNQDKAVYDRVAGGESSRPGQESLISTNEQPVDVVQRTLLPENLPLEGEEDEDMVAAAGTPVGDTEDARLLPRGERPAAQTPEESPVSVSPRKVRTMIVKPDGTLVAQEVPVGTAPPAATAASTPPPANSALSGLSAPSGDAAPAVVSTTTMPAANTPAVNTPAANAAPPVDTQVAAVPPAARNATRDTAPVPSSRPSDQPANVVATVTSGGNLVNGRQTTGSTPTPPPAETAAVTTSTPSSGGYYIQVASLPTEAEAQRSYKSLTGKFGPVIAGRGVDIKRADIAGKGTFYRVRIPAGDKAAAVTLCEKYRQAGGTCIVAQ